MSQINNDFSWGEGRISDLKQKGKNLLNINYKNYWS